MKTYVKDFMEGIDKHIQQVGDWGKCHTHCIFHINKKVTLHSQITRANENQDFWSSYAVKPSGPTASTGETDNTMNSPPPRMIRNVQVSYSTITQKTPAQKHLTLHPLPLQQRPARLRASVTPITMKKTKMACNS
jgi:hypothetical protein